MNGDKFIVTLKCPISPAQYLRFLSTAFEKWGFIIVEVSGKSLDIICCVFQDVSMRKADRKTLEALHYRNWPHCNLQTAGRNVISLHKNKAGRRPLSPPNGLSEKTKDQHPLAANTTWTQSGNTNAGRDWVLLKTRHVCHRAPSPCHTPTPTGEETHRQQRERLIHSRDVHIPHRTLLFPAVSVQTDQIALWSGGPADSGTINNYWVCLVSCGPDTDRRGKQTKRRHIKGSQ